MSIQRTVADAVADMENGLGGDLDQVAQQLVGASRKAEMLGSTRLEELIGEMQTRCSDAQAFLSERRASQ